MPEFRIAELTEELERWTKLRLLSKRDVQRLLGKLSYVAACVPPGRPFLAFFCIQERSKKAEPLIPSVLPDRPWQKIGIDLFELKGKPYLLSIDYFSRFAEVALLSKGTTAPDAIILISSLGLQDMEFQIKLYRTIVPSFKPANLLNLLMIMVLNMSQLSKYPQSNGEVERAVKTVKSLLRKSTNPYLALMAYRSTSLENGYSPSELLFGRKIRTTVPVLPSNLLPCWPHMSQFRQKDNDIKEKQKHYLDKHQSQAAT